MNPRTASFNLAVPQPARGYADGMYQKIVLQLLRRMTRGCLQVQLPDGTTHVFGEAGAARTATVRVNRWQFFQRCVLHGDVGFGEGYVDGDWDTDDIKGVISWFILNVENSPGMSGSRARQWLINLLGWENRLRHWLRPNSQSMSRRNISEHYDLGNNFYRLFLDPTMTYSAALFTTPTLNLEAAQVAKYDRLCRYLKLKPGDHLLEIGSGWGGFSRHAAINYGCRITTVTISEEQFKYASDLFRREGLAGRVEIRLEDYRALKGRYDKIVSIEMLEAVGENYFETYFGKCHELLQPHGLLALQMITCPDGRFAELRDGVDWIQKHIFPGSLLPSIHRVNEALRKTGELFLHDLKDMGLSYAETLKRWRAAFNENEAAVRGQGFDDRFLRKWNYYLAYCEAAFAMRNITVVQAIYTRPNNPTLSEP